MIYLAFDEMDPGFCFGLEQLLVEENLTPEVQLLREAQPLHEVQLPHKVHPLLDSHPEEDIFLLWHTVPTLMLGRFQSPETEINLAYAKKQGIQVVRRPSGGGTIYTDPGTWQFSFIRREANRVIDFKPFVEPIRDALRELGFPVEMSGRNDLMIHGRKCSGNAQYFSKGYQVHHGSILFDADLEAMVRCLTVDEAKFRAKGISSVRQRVANLSEFQPNLDTLAFRDLLLERVLAKAAPAGTPTAAAATSAARAATAAGTSAAPATPATAATAATATGTAVKTRHLTAAEDQKIREELAPRFSSEEWVYGKSPAYDFHKKTVLPGGIVEVQLTIKRNQIDEVKILGDFFYAGEIAEVEAKLRGAPYTREGVGAALADENLHLISPAEWVDCFF